MVGSESVGEAICVTPGMAPGVTDHLWSIGELVTTALAAPVPSPILPPGQLPLQPIDCHAGEG
jgi:hypothetical protein